jgi:hypothetical protein
VFGSGGNNDLFGSKLQSVVTFKLAADGLAQIQVSRNGGVPGMVLIKSLLKSGSPMLRLITLWPLAVSSRLIRAIASVSDSAILLILSEKIFMIITC